MKALTFKEGHRVSLLQGGMQFFPCLIDAIDASTQEVRLETYIFHGAGAGEQVAAALERAAQRGVRVYLVVDGVGTSSIPTAWTTRWSVAGVQWHQFSPMGRLGWLVPGVWRRLHRKLCVVDGHTAFCGGINILDDYFDPGHGAQESPRFDFAVMVQGPLVADTYHAMESLWNRQQISRQLKRMALRSARHTWMSAQRPAHVTDVPLYRRSEGAFAGVRAALVLRDNLRNRNRIERVYLKAIADARNEIVIANAYFLPGGRLRRALIHAARRGVRVRLLLQGRYEYFMQYHGARTVLGVLLASGVEIHEYAVGFLHAKVAVVDGQWATVGSSNLDPLSLLLAREANVVVDDAVFAGSLRTCLVAAMDAHGTPLDATSFGRRPWRQRILDRVAFGVMRVLLFLTGNRY